MDDEGAVYRQLLENSRVHRHSDNTLCIHPHPRAPFSPKNGVTPSNVSAFSTTQLVSIIAKVDTTKGFQLAVETLIERLAASEAERLHVGHMFSNYSSTLFDTWTGLASCGDWSAEGVKLMGRLITDFWRIMQSMEPLGGGDRVIQWLLNVLLLKGGKTKQICRLPPKHLRLVHDTFNEVVSRLTADDLGSVPGLVLSVVDTLGSQNAIVFKLMCTMYAHTISISLNLEEAGFPDFVDVVIGWMLDDECSEDMSDFCHSFLLCLKPHFVQDAAFTKTLIKQVAEDMETELELGADINCNRVMLLTRAFTAILDLKAIDDKALVIELSDHIIGMGKQILGLMAAGAVGVHICQPIAQKLLLAMNKVLASSPGVDGTNTRCFVKAQIDKMRKKEDWKRWSHLSVSIMWNGICGWLEGAISTTQLPDDTLDIANSLVEFVDEMSDPRRVKVVETLLRTRNVPLLQKVWAWHIGKLERVGREDDDEGDEDKGDDDPLYFVLSGISDLAVNKRGSILTLYALEPSIFDLLVSLVRRETLDIEKIRIVLNLLEAHCFAHSHWVASLSSSEFSTGSPGAKFFKTLLIFWEEILFSSSTLFTVQDKRRLLVWIHRFLTTSKTYASSVFTTGQKFFQSLLNFLCSAKGDHHDIMLDELVGKDDVSFSCGGRALPPPPTPLIVREKTRKGDSTGEQPGPSTRPVGNLPVGEDYTSGLVMPPFFQKQVTTPPDEQQQLLLSPVGRPTCEQGWAVPEHWPYLEEATMIFDTLIEPGSPYVDVVDLQALLVSFCKLHVMEGRLAWDVPPDMKPLLVKVALRGAALVVSNWGPRDLTVTPYRRETRRRRGDECNILQWMDRTANAKTDMEEDCQIFFMPTDFSTYLYELTGTTATRRRQRRTSTASVEGDDGESLSLTVPEPPWRGRAAVDFVIHSKLKTVLGSPIDFFSLIQTVFKEEKGVVPGWKFDFLFQLEQGLELWGNGSCFMNGAEMPDAVRGYFMVNRGSCLEWLKRVRWDVLNCAGVSDQWEDSFFHASMGKEWAKGRVALFHLNDGVGLGGKDTWERAASLYIQGRFEEATQILEDSSHVENQELKELITTRAARMLELDFVLQQEADQQKAPLLDFLIPSETGSKSCSITLMDEGLILLQKMIGNKGDGKLYSSLDVDRVVEKREVLDLWVLIKAADALRYLPEVPTLEKWFIWLRLGQEMLSAGNLVWVENFVRSLGVELKREDDQPYSLMTRGIPDNLDYEKQARPLGQLVAKLLFRRGCVDGATQVYKDILLRDPERGNLIKVTNEEGDQIPSLTTGALDLLLEIGRNLAKPHPDQFNELLEQMGWNSGPGCEEESDLKTPLVRHLERILDDHGDHPEAWLELGNAFFDDVSICCEGTSLKRALNAYANHLRFSCFELCPVTRDGVLVKTICRVISLIKHALGVDGEETGLECDLREILKHPRWLDFLPAIVQVPKLREAMLDKFPEKTAMYLWAHDSSRSEGETSVAAMGRKGLFDPSSYGVVDVNEEQHYPTYPLISYPPCCLDRQATYPVRPYMTRSHLGISTHVDTLAKELLRLATSPEELWSNAMQRILNDWHRRINMLKKDMARDPDPAKVTAYVDPIVTYLEDMWSHITDTACSPAQAAFVLKNSVTISAQVFSLKSCTNVDSLLRTFTKLFDYCDTFQSSVAMRSQLDYLSPKLASFQEWGTVSTVTLLGMPGNVHIVGIHPVVFSLPTKTRPKKVRFFASNGKSYEYLVKGNENLNVDSGMMQLLTLSQSFLKEPVWTYAVTPLGNRGGLIQMVQRATPAFQLYKRHLNRTIPGERTTEMFWKKMASFGVVGRDRMKVDGFTLKQVYLALLNESPKDLISREMFFGAASAKGWFKAVKGFTRDCAISASIGYLMGIGDRHLDNILVDVEDGKLVHVDFSLVFGRGAKLRVPEMVPFRMTQNFAAALQFPGMLGPFSNRMEMTISAFQANKELAFFCGRTIAFATQIGENYVIDPTKLRTVEVISAINIFKMRYIPMIQNIRTSRAEIAKASQELNQVQNAIKQQTDLVAMHSICVEHLTVTMGHIKNAEYDASLLHELHSRVVLMAAPSAECVEEQVLFRLTKQCRESPRSGNLEGDPTAWLTRVGDLLTHELQTTVKNKFDESTRLNGSKKELFEKKATLKKRVNKMRRIVANLDPLVVFAAGQVGGNGGGTGFWGPFKALVEDKWIGDVAHFWLHGYMDVLPEEEDLLTAAEVAELTLMEIFLSVENVPPVTTDDLVGVDGNMEYIHGGRMDTLMTYLTEKVKGFNVRSSVELLLQEATLESNLCKMFEGWTPWI